MNAPIQPRLSPLERHLARIGGLGADDARKVARFYVREGFAVDTEILGACDPHMLNPTAIRAAHACAAFV